MSASIGATGPAKSVIFATTRKIFPVARGPGPEWGRPTPARRQGGQNDAGREAAGFSLDLMIGPSPYSTEGADDDWHRRPGPWLGPDGGDGV